MERPGQCCPCGVARRAWGRRNPFPSGAPVSVSGLGQGALAPLPGSAAAVTEGQARGGCPIGKSPMMWDQDGGTCRGSEGPGCRWASSATPGHRERGRGRACHFWQATGQGTDLGLHSLLQEPMGPRVGVEQPGRGWHLLRLLCPGPVCGSPSGWPEWPPQGSTNAAQGGRSEPAKGLQLPSLSNSRLDRRAWLSEGRGCCFCAPLQWVP